LNGVETIARLRQLCERWIYSACLGFALPDDDRQRSGFLILRMIWSEKSATFRDHAPTISIPCSNWN